MAAHIATATTPHPTLDHVAGDVVVDDVVDGLIESVQLLERRQGERRAGPVDAKKIAVERLETAPSRFPGSPDVGADVQGPPSASEGTPDHPAALRGNRAARGERASMHKLRVDRPTRLVHHVAPVEELEQPQSDVDRVPGAAAPAHDAVSIGRRGHAVGKHPGFEQLLAQAVDQIVDEREAVVGEGALLDDVEPHRLNYPAQLVAR